MFGRRVKSLLVAGFSVFLVSFFNPVLAQEDSAHKEAKNSFNAKEIIFGHVLNNHDFHIIDIVHDDGSKHPISIPLPVILYSKQRGLTAFMSSRFHHGEQNYDNYMMLTSEKIDELKLDPKKYNAQDIVAVDDKGVIDPYHQDLRYFPDAQRGADVNRSCLVYLGDADHRKKIQIRPGRYFGSKGFSKPARTGYYICAG